MKGSFLFITLLAVAFNVEAQDYHVVNVKGNVSVSGKTLKANDKLNADDQLQFSSKTDAIAVVSAKAGRFIISPTVQKKDGELMAYVKDAITPGTKKLSTRSGLFNNQLDFSRYFKDTILFLPVMKYRTSYKQDDKEFFFIRYKYDGEEINKKLVVSGDTLVIDRKELFSVDKRKIDPALVSNMRLLRVEESEARHFADLHIVVPEEGELIEGVKILKQLYPAKEVREETISYLNELYGKVDEMNFNKWYKTVN
jgi:hypothetical protein